MAVFAEEWPARFAANNALRSWDEVLRRCNRHERDQVRVRICHAERLGIDTDRLNLPIFRYDDPGKPSGLCGVLLREDRERSDTFGGGGCNNGGLSTGIYGQASVAH